MRIILLEKINNLGNIGEEVDVKPGYARNFLIPTTKAVLATKRNIASFEARRISLENNLMKIQTESERLISQIKKIGCVIISSKAGSSGKLFGSIGPREIARAITKTGIKISKYNVRLLDGKIRSIGNYDVIIQVYKKMSTVLNIRVVKQ